MGRNKVFTSPAERQRAYRQRLLDRTQPTPTTPSTPTKRRPPSRPKRLQAVITVVQELHDEYEQWRNSSPESFQNSETAAQLNDTVEQLEVILELLAALAPPKGFGRD